MDKPLQRTGHNIDGVVSPRRAPHRGQLTDARFARPPYGKLDGRLRGHVRKPITATRPTAASLPTPQRARLATLPRPQPAEHASLPKPQPSFTSTRPNLPTVAPVATRARHDKKTGRIRRLLATIRTKKFAARAGIVTGLVLLACVGWIGWKAFHATSKVFGSNSSLLGFLSPTPLKCESSGRCNILLAGNSADDPGHDGANLTDSIMVISLDMKNKTAFMLSVPRDLYVNIPGNGYSKINATYPDGQAQGFSQTGYAKGGMGLLEKTVSESFGIPISNYALVDYSALKEAVNAVGGISVNIQSDDPRGLYDPSIDYATHGPLVKLTNGTHTITGEQALDLARARGDAYGSYGFSASDFERTQNQRLMVLALKSKVASSSTLANPIKLGELFDAIGNNIHTDLTAGNVRRLYDLFKGVPNADIKSVGLNKVTLSGQQNVNLLANYATPTHESALIPSAGVGNYSQIQLYLKQLTSSNPVVREAANVVVLNGGNTTGLASAEGQVLTAKGMDVSATGDAPSAQASNAIIDNSTGKAPATLSALKTLFGVSTATTNAALTAKYPHAQFIVVLGTSQQMPTLPTSSP